VQLAEWQVLFHHCAAPVRIEPFSDATKDGRRVEKIILPILLVLAIAGSWWIYQIQVRTAVCAFRQSGAAENLQHLSTNGKVEPQEFTEVRATVAGLVRRLPVHLGDAVKQGQFSRNWSRLVSKGNSNPPRLRAAQARADLSTLTAGGRSADIAEIDGNLAVLRQQRQAAQATVESLDRLVKKQAATTYELKQAQDAVADLDTRIAAMQKRRPALVGQGEIEAAKAKIQEPMSRSRWRKLTSRRTRSQRPCPVRSTICPPALALISTWRSRRVDRQGGSASGSGLRG